jgi:hypothetical protein
MLTLLAPLFFLQTPLPQIEIRIEKAIELASPAVCCSQSKGQAKIGSTPRKARSLKQAWIEHQTSGKSLGIQETKAAYANLGTCLKVKGDAPSKPRVPLNASFGWTTQPPMQGDNPPIVRGKAIIMDGSGQQRVIEFDGDFPDIQGFLPAGIQLPNLGELIGKSCDKAQDCSSVAKGCDKAQGSSSVAKGCDKAQGCSSVAKGCDKAQGCSSVAKGCDKAQGCSSVAKGCDKAQGCSSVAKGCDKAQGCPVQGEKFGKTHAPHPFQTSGEVLWTPTTRAREELPEEIFEMIHSRGANHEWLHDHDEDEGELEEVLEEAHEALEEAYDRIDELEERLAHMEQVLEHISDELINEDR